MSSRRGFLARLGGLLGVVATCGPRALTASEPTTPVPDGALSREVGICSRCLERRQLVWTESDVPTGIAWDCGFDYEPSGPLFELRYCEPCARATAMEGERERLRGEFADRMRALLDASREMWKGR